MHGRVVRLAEDADLIARAQRGDDHAYGMLVERYQTIAFRTAWLVCGDAADAEDAAQEAFVKAHAALGRFRPGAPWRPWLLRIVANEASNARRSAGRRAHLAGRAAAGSPPGDVPGPDALALAGERRSALAAAVGRLDPAQRQVVLLRYVLDLSEVECAAVLGCRPGTVKSRASRALKRLRGELEAADA
jgi:RNA polymerase sigma-70 factor (ECF subfamily)